MINDSLDIRPSPIAGQWYPDDPTRLAASVDRYIQAANLPALEGQVVGVVAPHAGHMYSGPVAGYAFRALQGAAPDLVAVVSPMHHGYAQPLLTSAHAAYFTPLGAVPIDQPAVERLDALLEQKLGIGLSRVRRDPEHSLEIELPFLQRALSQPFSLLPVMIRDQSQVVIQVLGEALATVLDGRSAVMVASSDLSHFYSQTVANKLDDEVLKCIADFDPAGVLQIEEEGKGFACGRGAIATVLWAAKALGADRVKILHHATSGDVTGDYGQVVGYASAVIMRPPTWRPPAV